MNIEDWWSITVLISTMVSVTYVRNLWVALLISSLGRAFPSLVGATHQGLWQEQYRRAPLFVDKLPEEVDAGLLVLSPRCQCASMQTKRANQTCPCAVRKGECLRATTSLHGPGRRAPILFHRRKGDEMRAAPLQVLVPEWVSHSCFPEGMGVTDVLQERGPHDIMPRFHRWQERTVPAALQGQSRFKRKPAPCRCVVARNVPNRLTALRQATRSCCACIDSLRHNLGSFVPRWVRYPPGCSRGGRGL